MKRLETTGGILLWLVVVAVAVAEPPAEKPNTVTIPREKIIFAGPGAREFRNLEPEMFEYRDTPEKIAKYSTPEGIKEFARIIERANRESLVIGIERAMNAMPKGKEAKMGPGFAVEGQGRAALQGIYDVLVKNKEPLRHFSSDKELSLIFYNRRMQPGIHLESVTRTADVFNVKYLLVSHGMLVAMPNLALIPVGKLEPGEYHVNIERLPEKEAEFNQRGFPPVNVGFETNYVCKPFDFVVEKKPNVKGAEQ